MEKKMPQNKFKVTHRLKKKTFSANDTPMKNLQAE